MALTTEQQAQLDFQTALETARRTYELELETARHANQVALESKRAKLETVRLAQQTLVENRRNLPADQREIAASDITAFADVLAAYTNS